MSRPRLKLGSHLVPGVLALGLFGLFAAVFLTAPIGEPAGFPAGESIVASIGFSLLNVEAPIDVDGFLIALLTIALVLDAALDGALLLARRDDDEGGLATALGADGGEKR